MRWTGLTGTGIDPGSCAVSQARRLLVRTLPGSCAGLCPPLCPNVQERPPRWPHPRVRDPVAAVAALPTRGRRPSAPLLPSALETPGLGVRTAPPDSDPSAGPAVAPSPRACPLGHPLFSLRLPLPLLPLPGCGLRPPA